MNEQTITDQGVQLEQPLARGVIPYDNGRSDTLPRRPPLSHPNDSHTRTCRVPSCPGQQPAHHRVDICTICMSVPWVWPPDPMQYTRLRARRLMHTLRDHGNAAALACVWDQDKYISHNQRFNVHGLSKP
jgi:hypothetical protein